ncbi:MAG: hypothetical protein ACQERB_05550 [Promethearchaeati archaeon]
MGKDGKNFLVVIVIGFIFFLIFMGNDEILKIIGYVCLSMILAIIILSIIGTIISKREKEE